MAALDAALLAAALAILSAALLQQPAAPPAPGPGPRGPGSGPPLQHPQPRPVPEPRVLKPYPRMPIPMPISPETHEHLTAIGTHAYYVGELDAGLRALEQLLRSNLTEADDWRVRSNRNYYVRPLADYVTGAEFTRFEFEPPEPGWSLLNPSLVASPGGYTVLVRIGNYCGLAKEEDCATLQADGGVVRTTYSLIETGPRLEPLGPPRHIRGPEYAKSGFVISGLEDCRLNVIYEEEEGGGGGGDDDGSGNGNVSGGGAASEVPAPPASARRQLFVSGNIRDVAGRDSWPIVAAADLDLNRGELVNFRPIDPRKPGETEKNWMPFLGRRNEWLYHANLDGAVATVEAPGSTPYVSRRGASTHLARQFRGSGQLVRLPDGRWLGIVHEISFGTGHGQHGRGYEHRFVAFSGDDMSVAAESPPFYLREWRSVEYAAGLALRGTDAVVTFGVRDVEAWAVRLPIDGVLQLLEQQ